MDAPELFELPHRRSGYTLCCRAPVCKTLTHSETVPTALHTCPTCGGASTVTWEPLLIPVQTYTGITVFKTKWAIAKEPEPPEPPLLSSPPSAK